MKLLRVLAVALSVGVIAPAQAAFIGDYAYSNWNASLTYNDVPVSDFSGAGNTCKGGNCTTGNGDRIVLLNAGDTIVQPLDTPDGSGLRLESADISGTSNWQQFTIIAAFDSLISFDWEYGVGEVRDAQLFEGAFGFEIDGVFTALVLNSLADLNNAIAGLVLDAGQSFSFELTSNGQADLWAQISNFTVERNLDGKNTVPSPAPLALLGLGLIGMAYARRRQAA